MPLRMGGASGVISGAGYVTPVNLRKGPKMGYTHYWYRSAKSLNRRTMGKIVHDFKKLLPAFGELGIKLASGAGAGKAEINTDRVSFNGLESCGHPVRAYGVAWPSSAARGINNYVDACVRTRFGGIRLSTRSCGGNCSQEEFYFPRAIKNPQLERDGLFDCCVTYYKPYDVAVTAFLIIVKKHMGESIKVVSDGELNDWEDARIVCDKVLGWPDRLGFDFDEDGNLQLEKRGKNES